jgi:hypothetical protein
MSAQITEALGKLDTMISDAGAGASRAVSTAAAAEQAVTSSSSNPTNGSLAVGNGSATDNVASIRAELTDLFTSAINAALPAAAGTPAAVAQCGNPQFGDYQCNNAMALFGKLKGKVR